MVSARSQRWEKGILACFRSSDCGDNAKRCEKEKQRGGGVGGERLLSPSPSPPPYFFCLLSLNLCCTPLSERSPVVSIRSRFDTS